MISSPTQQEDIALRPRVPQPFLFQPSNSVAQELFQAPPQDNQSLPEFQYDPQPFHAPQQSAPSIPSEADLYARQYQQYSQPSPFVQQHPILTRVLGGLSGGLPGAIMLPQQIQQQRQAMANEAAINYQKAHGAEATYQFSSDQLNPILQRYGLPLVPEGAQISTKDAQEFLKNIGQGNGIQAYSDYNNRLQAYNARKQQFTAAYKAGKFPKETYDKVIDRLGPPPQAPETQNPYLDINAGDYLNSANTAAKTGQEGVIQANKNQTDIEKNRLDAENKGKLLDLKADIAEKLNHIREMNSATREHQLDSLNNYRNNMLDLKEKQLKDKENKPDFQQARILQTDLAQSEKTVENINKDIDKTEAILEKINLAHHKNPHGMRTDPGYAAANQKWKELNAKRDAAQGEVVKKSNAFQEFMQSGGQTQQQPQVSVPDQGRSLNKTTPSLKLKGLPRTQDALKRLGL